MHLIYSIIRHKLTTMRIRRKKNLEERLALLCDYILPIDTSIKNVKEAIEKKEYITAKGVFLSDKPLCLEIGCGKGAFIINMARLQPQFNYIAVEMMENIIVMAGESAKNNKISNVKFLNTSAEYLPRYLRENSIEKIFLNFSPPYPQKSYECRRLTNDRFVQEYYYLLKTGGIVEQKTDDYDFFIYSKEKFSSNGFEVLDVSDELSSDKNNIVTEYEQKFRSLGQPIYKLIAKKI